MRRSDTVMGAHSRSYRVLAAQRGRVVGTLILTLGAAISAAYFPLQPRTWAALLLLGLTTGALCALDMAPVGVIAMAIVVLGSRPIAEYLEPLRAANEWQPLLIAGAVMGLTYLGATVLFKTVEYD